MAKVDLYFTFRMWGDDEEIQEIKTANELQETLDGMIDDIIGGCEEFSYKADLTNHITGITVERELTKG